MLDIKKVVYEVDEKYSELTKDELEEIAEKDALIKVIKYFRNQANVDDAKNAIVFYGGLAKMRQADNGKKALELANKRIALTQNKVMK